MIKLLKGGVKVWLYILIGLLAVTFIIIGQYFLRANKKEKFSPDAYSSAIIKEDIPAVQILLKQGIDPDTIIFDPKHERFMYGRTQIDPLVLKDYTDTGLMVAAKQGNLELAKLLVQAGAKINYVNAKGNSSLISAILGGHFTMVEFLISYGAQVDLAPPGGDYPIIHASYKGSDQIVTYLLTHGAKVNSQGIDGVTALIAAAECGNERVVKLLIEGGANVNATDDEHHTALWVASHQGKSKVVDMLTSSGATE